MESMPEEAREVPTTQEAGLRHDRSVRQDGRLRGLGRILTMVYGLFAVAATARALFQLLTKFHGAPAAYLLSAVAAVVYLVATVCFGAKGWKRAALVAVSFEVVGVVTVGTVSLLIPAVFPAETVWSCYGRGYGFLPLVLPFLGLWWLKEAEAVGIRRRNMVRLH